MSTDPFQRVSFLIVVDGVNTATFPVTTPVLFVVFGFSRKTPGFLMDCSVDIMPPDGEAIASQKIADVAFRPDQLAQRAVVGFQGITWQKPGDHTVRFMSRGRCISSFNVRVNLVPSPPMPSR